MTSSPGGWVPSACTLPTAEQPLRVAEFDALFADVRTVDRPEPVRLVLSLDAPVAVVRDLAARESECCSFFAFDVVEQAGSVRLTIVVPPAHVDVLDALAARAS
jgi:hypothetical protein